MPASLEVELLIKIIWSQLQRMKIWYLSAAKTQSMSCKIFIGMYIQYTCSYYIHNLFHEQEISSVPLYQCLGFLVHAEEYQV